MVHGNVIVSAYYAETIIFYGDTSRLDYTGGTLRKLHAWHCIYMYTFRRDSVTMHLAQFSL